MLKPFRRASNVVSKCCFDLRDENDDIELSVGVDDHWCLYRGK